MLDIRHTLPKVRPALITLAVEHLRNVFLCSFPRNTHTVVCPCRVMLRCRHRLPVRGTRPAHLVRFLFTALTTVLLTVVAGSESIRAKGALPLKHLWCFRLYCMAVFLLAHPRHWSFSVQRWVRGIVTCETPLNNVLHKGWTHIQLK